jgi:hypothetical protein
VASEQPNLTPPKLESCRGHELRLRSAACRYGSKHTGKCMMQNPLLDDRFPKSINI